ncbi:MAG: ATP-binding protein [Oligoflexus sp.]
MLTPLQQKTLSILITDFSWPSSKKLPWIKSFLDYHIYDRLVEPSPQGPELSLLESCSISREGNSYRLQLKKQIFFHDGSEVTSESVISTLVQCLNSHQDSTNLKHLLRTPQNPISSFRRHSRYRFEILLNQPVGDLLQRLAHPSFQIAKPDEPWVGSGPWKLTAENEHTLELQTHSNGCRLPHSYYQRLQVTSISDQEDPESLSTEQAFILMYPGSERKTFNDRLTSDITSYRLETEIQFAISLKSCSGKNEKLSVRLRQACHDFLAKKSQWNRRYLDGILHESHPCHFPLKFNYSPLSQDEQAISLKIAYEPGTISETLLQHLRIFLSGRGLDCQFIRKQHEVSGNKADSDSIDGKIIYWTSHPQDDMWTVWEQIANAVEQFPGKTPYLRKNPASQVQLSHRLREFLQQLNRESWFIPFMRAPLIIDSNQAIDLCPSPLGIFPISQIKMSRSTARHQEFQQQALAAIGSAVQIFAHDVKKPFSLLQGLFALIEATDNPSQVKELVSRHLPDLKRSIQDVNGMLHDIIAITDQSDIIKEPFSIGELVQECLRDLLLIHDERHINLQVHFHHQSLAEGDRYKISRVIANIIVNARQAMPKAGLLSIQTLEDASKPDFITISIHNSGSYIPPDIKNVIFEAFYTFGKKQGTGLGLAIAKKIVHAHGGNITCQSSQKEGTTFQFTIPKANALDISEKGDVCLSPIQLQANHSQPAIQKICGILMIDDEPVYLNQMEDLIQTLSDFPIHFFRAENPSQAFQVLKIEGEKINLIIVDVDLGINNCDGFDLVKRFREQKVQAKICLHSNRNAFTTQKKVSACGADLFIPKPMNSKQLRKLVRDAFTDPNLPDEIKNTERTPTLLVIDDDIIVLEQWELHGDSCRIRTFDNPDAALQYLQNEAQGGSDIDAIIMDFYFSGQSKTGVEYAEQIKKIFNWPIYLMSDAQAGSFDTNQKSLFIDCLEKDPANFLKRFLKIYQDA